MIEFVVGLSVFAVLAVVFAKINDRLFPHWSIFRLSLLSALPIPLLVGVPAIWLYYNVVVTPRARCGVDACGMAMVGATVFLLIAVIGYLAGIAAAAFFLSQFRNR